MARIRALVTTGVATAAVGASLLATAGPALADPPAGTYRPIVGVGSDTIQDVINAAAGDVAGTTGVFTNVASYNAFGSTTIQVTRTGAAFTRPAGSSEGRRALYASVVGTTYRGTDVTNQVDFARSSSFTATGTAGSPDRAALYVPFARDGVSYAYKGGTAAKVGKLTSAQLKTIYSASGPVTINGVSITAYLPQAGSGTRSFWLGALGLSETTIGAGVQTLGAENDGRVIPAGTITSASIIPFSAAQYIGQSNGVQTDTRDGALLGRPDNKTVYTVDEGGVAAPNSGYFNTAPYGRSVYNVIDGPTAPQALKNLFITNGSRKAPLCTPAGLALSKQYGFAPILTSRTGQTCGVAITGAYPTPTP